MIKRNYEIWKDIEGFPGYQISNLGKVKSFKGLKPRILKQCLDGKGYLQTSFNKKSIKIHSLVITHFGSPKPTPLHECNHIDGDKTNNWWNNLEWMTKLENIQHAIDMGLRNYAKGENQGSAKLTESEVIEIRKLSKLKINTERKLSQLFKVSQPAIHNILINKTWNHI